MAKYGTSNSVSGMARIEEVNGLQLNVEEIELQTKQVDYDPMAAMGDILKDAEKKQNKTGIGVSDLPDLGGLADITSMEVLSEAQRKLQEAQGLIQNRKYKKAIAVLDEIVDDEACGYEASYLRGFCCLKVNDPMGALRSVRPLLDVRLASDLQARVDVLRSRAGSVLLIVLLKEMFFSSPKALEKRLAELTDLDPQNGMFWFMYAVTLMRQDRVQEAQAVVNRAVAVKNINERNRLEELGRQLGRRRLRELLAPAVAEFKRRNYPKALSIAAALAKKREYVKMSLLVTFTNYLRVLSGGGGILGRILGRKSVPQQLPCPKGSRKDIEDLYFLLVGHEIRDAQNYMKKDQSKQAQNILEEAYKYAPHFPYLNFLLALNLYREFGKAVMVKKKPPTPDQLVNQLQRIQTLSQVAAQDHELRAATYLLNQVDRLLKQVDESKIVRECYSAFNRIAEGKAKIEPRQLPSELKRIQSQAKAAQSRCTYREAKEALQRLVKGIDTTLSGLQTAMAEAEQVKECMEEFNQLMIGPKRSSSEITNKLKRLRTKARSCKSKVKNAQNKEVLDQLIHAIDKGINTIREATADNEIMESTVGRFNNLMGNMSCYAGDPQGLMKELIEIRQAATNNQGRCQSSHSEQQLTKLIDAIDNVFKQFQRGY